jgi:nitrate reductase NapE component
MKSDKLKARLQPILKQLMGLRIPLFLLLVVGVYGFIVWRISTLQQVQPNLDAVSSKLQASTHIDQATITKVKQLQDNSVNVNALFNKARNNPFQE